MANPQNDPNIFNMNVQQMAEAFVADIQCETLPTHRNCARSISLFSRSRSASYLTDEILIAWGCDFAFLNAHVNYKNMDKLMEYINANTSYGRNSLSFTALSHPRRCDGKV